MIESEKIKNSYINLLDLLQNEVNLNSGVLDYFNHLNEYRGKFIDLSNVSIKEELKEFLRGANRYSDEISFTDENYHQIRTATNSLFDILNTSVSSMLVPK